MFNRAKVVVVGVVLVVAGFIFSHARSKDAQDECVHSLHHLCEAKGGWAEEHHGTSNDTPTWSDLRPYYVGPTPWPTNEPAPRCPGGGTWTIGRLQELPTCSIAKHTASFRHDVDEVEDIIHRRSSNTLTRSTTKIER